MDILDRIVEAVAEKLISIRLEEVTWEEVQTARRNNAAKKAGRAAGAGKEYGHDRPESERPKSSGLSKEQAGVKGGDRFSHDHPKSLATGTEDDPFNRAARKKPIKPEKSKTKGPGGGKENRRGVES